MFLKYNILISQESWSQEPGFDSWQEKICVRVPAKFDHRLSTNLQVHEREKSSPIELVSCLVRPALPRAQAMRSAFWAPKNRSYRRDSNLRGQNTYTINVRFLTTRTHCATFHTNIIIITFIYQLNKLSTDNQFRSVTLAWVEVPLQYATQH